jgi:hypothetical protein
MQKGAEVEEKQNLIDIKQNTVQVQRGGVGGLRAQESAACSLLKETLRKTLQYLSKTEPFLVT